MDCKVAVLAGHHLSFLDHIVPLCDLFAIPLFCPDLWEWVELYYPPIARAHSLEEGEKFLYVEPSRLHQRAFQFGQHLVSRKGTSLCALHGNSNKCREVFWVERFVEEDVVLLYGHYMQRFFEEKGVWERLRCPIFCGNYRLRYYEKHRDFFSLSLPGEGKRVLYAPTWTFFDATDDSPFFSVHRALLDSVPAGYTVFVKLHPYMYRLHPEKVDEIERRYADCERVVFLKPTPLVYPLLDQIDIYIGDHSSVGYDFLAFDRPLFFLGENIDPLLLECGEVLKEGEIFAQLESEGESAKRQALYRECFADVTLEELRCAVLESW